MGNHGLARATLRGSAFEVQALLAAVAHNIKQLAKSYTPRVTALRMSAQFLGSLVNLPRLAAGPETAFGNRSPITRPPSRVSQTDSTVVVSNHPVQSWYDLFANPVLAESVLDRLVNSSHHILMEGRSYRSVTRPGSADPPGEGRGSD
jgi:hypothetical protein